MTNQSNSTSFTVGEYLAERMVQIGLKEHFALAGDYNLILLDQLLKNKNTKQIYSCNELNCGFAAEGYARANGAAACVVTFSVGCISAMNSALGGAYAENLPVLLVTGAPNSDDYGTGHRLHHTTGEQSWGYTMEMAKTITCAAESIIDAEDAPKQIDHVITTMLREQKPAYLEIACNIASAPCKRPGPAAELFEKQEVSQSSLKTAVEKILAKVDKAENVVIYVGPKTRPSKANKEVLAFAEKLGCAVVSGPGAFAFFPGKHPQFRGVYWGDISTGDAQKLVEEADALIILGPNWNDYSTTGWKYQPKGPGVITLDPKQVFVDDTSFPELPMKEVLSALTAQVKAKPASAKNSKPLESVYKQDSDSSKPLTNAEMAAQIQAMLDDKTTLHAETGDSWFNAQEMIWPNGSRIEVEMQWGHIGWSIPSGFGGAVASPERQHIIMCGDGSFQLTAQEVGQMVRYGLPVIIFLIDNNGYGIEKAIHDGPYNYIQNWNYCKIMDLFNGTPGNGGLGLKATTGAELADAIKKAKANKKGPTLIHTVIPDNSHTDKLYKWGSEVAKTNSRSRK